MMIEPGSDDDYINYGYLDIQSKLTDRVGLADHIRQLFCKHKYTELGWISSTDTNIKSRAINHCPRCSKTKLG